MRKLAICAVLVLASTTFTYAGANKIRSFTPVGVENDNADGMAILHYHPKKAETSVLITLSNFTPNTSYDLALSSPTYGTAVSLDVLVTDEHGNANFKMDFAGDFSEADILIYASDDPQFTEDELRAVGSSY